MQHKYPNLLKPFTIGKFTFKNRMLGGPLGTPISNNEGYLLAENINYYDMLARGGAARVITGDITVNGVEAGYNGGLWRPRFFDKDIRVSQDLLHSFREYADVLHRHDTLAFTNFTHDGIVAANSNCNFVYGPVAGWREATARAGRTEIIAMDEKIMDQICEQFAMCAGKAKEFWLDGCLIHGGHGKIMDQWRSKRINTRTDKYGGSVENRCRFPIMILQRVRERVGKDFLIELRFSAVDFIKDSIVIEDTIEFLKMLDGTGLVDLIHVAGGTHFDALTNMHMASPAYYPPAVNREFAHKIKAAGIKIPLVLINSINDPDIAEDIIASGDADFVCMSRQICLADPFFPRKVMEEKTHLINNCLRCHACYDYQQCAVNPMLQRESKILQWVPQKAPISRKVVIIGGGITGMKAAETASALGHKVILFEKAPALGGQLNFSDTDSYKFDIRRFKNNMIRRITEDENITLHLNTVATPELVKAELPYAVIAAVGASPYIPNILGVNGKNVMTYMDVYNKADELGESIIMVGGGLTSCEIAMHLGKLVKKVIILEMADQLAPNEPATVPVFEPIPGILLEYEKMDVKIETGCTCSEIFEGGVKAIRKDGTKVTFMADTVVLASGMIPNRELAQSFAGLSPYFAIAGDCRKPGKIKGAVAAGYHTVMDI